MKTELPISLEEANKIECLRMSDEGWVVVPASSKRSWMDETNGHAYRCLPLVIANQMGWVILSPSGFSAIWNGGPGDHDIKVIAEDEKYERQFMSHFGHGIVTFTIPYIFKTNNDLSLLVRGATNFWIDGAHALDGLVETHWSNYSFTMNWKITQPNKLVHFKKGDPVCMIIPYPTRLLQNIQVSSRSILEEKAINEFHTRWGAYRRAFNSDPHRGNNWQKDYFVGRLSPFEEKKSENMAPYHVTKLNLPRFDEKT